MLIKMRWIAIWFVLAMLLGCQPQRDVAVPTQPEETTILPTKLPSKESGDETVKPTAEAMPSATPVPEEAAIIELMAEIPKLCGETLPPLAPIGSKPTADIQLAEPGYFAEWFVPPGQFIMPLEVLISPEGQILVHSVRSSTLTQVSSDGDISIYTDLIRGNQGAIDAAGTVYMYSSSGGTIWRGGKGGWGSEYIRTDLIDTPCLSGFGLAHDSSLYVAVNSCGEKSVLYQITSDKKINLVNNNIPNLVALRSTPDSHFLALGGKKVYEISLIDFQVTELYDIPLKGDVVESGMAVDDVGNIYLSSEAQDGQAELWQVSPFGDITQIAEIPVDGLSGIEWLRETNEIIGAQSLQGSLLAVNVENGTIREVVAGNGLVTPMAMAFSACGDLAVSNADSGGFMALVNPAGEVSHFFNYRSDTPPIPYLAISTESVVYASESGFGLSNGITMMAPGAQRNKDYLRDITPSGILWREDGSLLVTETITGRILEIDTQGNPRVHFDGLHFPQALSWGPDGSLYVTVGGEILSDDLTVPFAANSILRITADGRMEALTGTPDGLFALAVSPQDELYAAARQTIYKINESGNVTEFASGFEGAVGLAFDLSGSLYVSDHVANGIIRISGFPQGNLNGVVRYGNGTPAAAVQVKLFSVKPLLRGLAVVTDEQGLFSLAAAPGSYTVVVLKDGVEAAREGNVQVIAEEIIRLEMIVD